MEIQNIDLEELKKQREEIIKERNNFDKRYAKWSEQQAKIVNC